MSDLEAIFEQAEALMDDVVDDKLGDVVQMRVGAGDWTDVKLFVLDEDGRVNLTALDSLDYRIRLKVRKSLVPNPSQTSFKGGKLGARAWTPAGSIGSQAGKYWLFDIMLKGQ